MNELKKFFYAMTILLAGACDNSSDLESLAESLNFKLPFKEDNGYDIAKITVKIAKAEFSETMELTIVDSIATGSFKNLEPDLYQIEISVFNSENTLLVFGESEVSIRANQTINCLLSLYLTELTGELAIGVHFDFPSSYDSVLFIGNSYTYFNGGLDVHLENMMHEYQNSNNFKASKVCYGGYSLEQHFHKEDAIAAIQAGGWELVILQEHSTRPLEDKELMFKYVGKFDSLIKDNLGDTGFFMTWAREYDQSMIEGLAATYKEVANTFGAKLSPVGLAFSRAYEETNINLYASDGSHPSKQGTYLAACVFFCFLTKHSPVGLEYDMQGEISTEEKEQLQLIAWEVFEGMN